MNYYITFTDINGVTKRYPGAYITLRKERDEVKWMLTRGCYSSVTIWKGFPGGARVKTYKVSS